MGSKNCPETPRQKMIGMMYLVLTAMLALNVSKDILNAFATVNGTLEETNLNFTSKIDETYAVFAKLLENQPKAKPYYEKAMEAKKIFAENVQYMEDLKLDFFCYIDGKKPEQIKGKTLAEMDAKDNFDKPTTYFINNKKADEMVAKFNKMKADVEAVVASVDTSGKFKLNGLNVDKKFENANKESETWAQHNFEHVVAAGVYTLLNNMIGEMKNMEYETVKYLIDQIDAGTFKFDNVSAKVIPNSRIVFSGDAFEADIIVAASDSRQALEVFWAGGRDKVSEDELDKLKKEVSDSGGVVHLKIPTGGIGDQKFAGKIKVQGPEGDKYYDFSEAYTVTKPTAAVAAEKMNVFYAGIPNPVTISAPVAAEKLRINWGGCNATSLGGGRYDVTVPQNLAGKTVNVTVSADMGGGKAQNMGTTPFRVKPVPEPTASIGSNITSGRQPKDLLLANPLIVARMSPDFNYELRWNVVSYKVTFVKNNVEEAPITVSGGRFPDNVVSKIRSASSGTQMEISDIKVQSIAGARTLKTILVRIK